MNTNQQAAEEQTIAERERSRIEKEASEDDKTQSRLDQSLSLAGKQISIPLTDLSERYAFLDPASGKTAADLKRVSARSAIIVLAVDSLGRMFTVYAWADRVHTHTLIDKIFQVQQTYNPRRFGIEANALQSLFADCVRMAAEHAQIRLPLIPIMQSTRVNKEFRIRTALQTPMAEGRILFQPSQHELIREVSSFPNGQLVDLIDALASCVSMIPRRRLKRQKNREAEKLASYLRGRGASPRYIEKRIKELHKKSSIRNLNRNQAFTVEGDDE